MYHVCVNGMCVNNKKIYIMLSNTNAQVKLIHIYSNARMFDFGSNHVGI